MWIVAYSVHIYRDHIPAVYVRRLDQAAGHDHHLTDILRPMNQSETPALHRRPLHCIVLVGQITHSLRYNSTIGGAEGFS